MKYAIAALCLICASGFWLAAKDYPYSCSGSFNCPDKCNPQGQIVTCTLAAVLPYPTTCHTAEGETWLECIVRNGSGEEVSRSSRVRCLDCEDGPSDPDDGTTGCDPLSVDWFTSCDPFAY